MTTFDEFFADHYDEVVRTLALAVGDRQRAEDATQEAFAKAFRKWPTVSRMDRPVGWVIVVGMNQLKRWITRGEKQVASAAVADAPDPADGIATATSVRSALDRLGPRQRATVVLRYLCDLPTADVAQALGCSPGTVKSALHAGLANLRVDLTEPPATPPRRAPLAPTTPAPGEEVRDANR
jgi:RNA polymerase sigma-70 factor (sigma-E family)